MDNKALFPNSIIGRPETVRVQTSMWRNWIEPFVEPASFTAREKTALVKQWLDAKLSPVTIKMLLSICKKYVEWSGYAYPANGNITRNIMRLQPAARSKSLSKSEAKKLLKAAQYDKIMYPILLLGIHAGLRKGEVFGLQRDDVDLLGGVIKVQRSWDGPTKSGRPRVVPISRELEQALISAFDFIQGRPVDRLFKPFDANARLAGYCHEAGVPEITFHGLRHTFATWALESGISPKLVQDALGHAHLSTTLDVYWDKTGGRMDLSFLEAEEEDPN